MIQNKTRKSAKSQNIKKLKSKLKSTDPASIKVQALELTSMKQKFNEEIDINLGVGFSPLVRKVLWKIQQNLIQDSENLSIRYENKLITKNELFRFLQKLMDTAVANCEMVLTPEETKAFLKVGGVFGDDQNYSKFKMN